MGRILKPGWTVDGNTKRVQDYIDEVVQGSPSIELTPEEDVQVETGIVVALPFFPNPEDAYEQIDGKTEAPV